MIRRLLFTYLLPFLAPFIVYGLWLAFIRYKARRAGSAAGRGWSDAPWTWLIVAGVILVSASLVSLGLVRDAPPGAKYFPPRLENGVIVPAHTE